MAWLFFALAAGAVWIAFSTFSIGLAAVCLLVALGLIIAGALMLASARISSQSQNPARMLDSKTLAAMRQKANTPAAAGAGGGEAMHSSDKRPLGNSDDAAGGADGGD